MRNTEGSFVLLDNLFYEAEFCRVSSGFWKEFNLKIYNFCLVDFGPDFHSER